MLLSDYRATLRRYLHDASDTLFSLADKDAFINEGLQQRDLDTGGNRSILTFSMVAGTDTYTLTTIGNANVFDVIGMTIIITGNRYPLMNMTLSALNANGLRLFTATTDIPYAWTRYGNSQIIVAPIPSQAFSSEADVLLYSAATLLVNPGDADPLPFPYTYPVCFYAAYLAKVNERQYDEAEMFLNRYQQTVVNINAARTGSVPSMLPSAFR